MTRYVMMSVLLAAGCGGVPVTPSGGLAATPEIQAACEFFSDADIDAAISATDADRQNGASFESQVSVLDDVCITFPDDFIMACDACFTAILNHVYGL